MTRNWAHSGQPGLNPFWTASGQVVPMVEYGGSAKGTRSTRLPHMSLFPVIPRIMGNIWILQKYQTSIFVHIWTYYWISGHISGYFDPYRVGPLF